MNMKKQTEITKESDNGIWEKDNDVPFSDEAAEVIKLQPGESVEGVLLDVYASKKWQGKQIYKIKEKTSDVVKVLVGTTILDRKMTTKKVGDLVKIQRNADLPSKKGNPLQSYDTFSPKSGA